MSIPFNKWQLSILEHQNAIYRSTGNSPNKLHVWCPFLGEYIEASDATVIHIIPSSIACYDLPYQLGYEADHAAGVDIIRDRSNGIIMTSALHEEFRNGGLVLLPIETKEGEPQRWRFKLLNWERAGFQVGNSNYTFYTLEDKELNFQRGAARPGRRYLYWHYAVSILRASKRNADLQLAGLSIVWELRKKPKHYHHCVPDFKNVGIATPPDWGQQCKYIRKSMMKALSSLLGDGRLKEADFAEGVWEGQGPSDAIFDEEVASHLALFMDRDWAADDESDDDLSGSTAETRADMLNIRGLAFEMPQRDEGESTLAGSHFSDSHHSA